MLMVNGVCMKGCSGDAASLKWHAAVFL